MRTVAISLRAHALRRSVPSVGQRRVPIVARPGALASTGPPIASGVPAVSGRVPSSERGRRRNTRVTPRAGLARGRVSVAAGSPQVALLRGLVPPDCGHIPRSRGSIATSPRVVARLSDVVSGIAGHIPARGCLVTLPGRTVSLVRHVVALVTDVIPLPRYDPGATAPIASSSVTLNHR